MPLLGSAAGPAAGGLPEGTAEQRNAKDEFYADLAMDPADHFRGSRDGPSQGPQHRRSEQAHGRYRGADCAHHADGARDLTSIRGAERAHHADSARDLTSIVTGSSTARFSAP